MGEKNWADYSFDDDTPIDPPPPVADHHHHPAGPSSQDHHDTNRSGHQHNFLLYAFPRLKVEGSLTQTNQNLMVSTVHVSLAGDVRTKNETVTSYA